MDRKEGHPAPPQLSWFLSPRSLVALQTRFNSAKKPPTWMTGECSHFGQSHRLCSGVGEGFALILLLHGNWLLITQSGLLHSSHNNNACRTSRALFTAPIIRMITVSWQHICLLQGICHPGKGLHTRYLYVQLWQFPSPTSSAFFALPANAPLMGISECLRTEHIEKKKSAFT